MIRDPRIHRRTLYDVAGALEAAGADIMGAMPSPITGAAGNTEFLLHARAPAGAAGRRRPPRPFRVGPARRRALAEAERSAPEG